MIVRGGRGGANTIYWHNNIHKQNQKCFKNVSPCIKNINRVSKFRDLGTGGGGGQRSGCLLELCRGHCPLEKRLRRKIGPQLFFETLELNLVRNQKEVLSFFKKRKMVLHSLAVGGGIRPLSKKAVFLGHLTKNMKPPVKKDCDLC